MTVSISSLSDGLGWCALISRSQSTRVLGILVNVVRVTLRGICFSCEGFHELHDCMEYGEGAAVYRRIL